MQEILIYPHERISVDLTIVCGYREMLGLQYQDGTFAASLFCWTREVIEGSKMAEWCETNNAKQPRPASLYCQLEA